MSSADKNAEMHRNSEAAILAFVNSELFASMNSVERSMFACKLVATTYGTLIEVASIPDSDFSIKKVRDRMMGDLNAYLDTMELAVENHIPQKHKRN